MTRILRGTRILMMTGDHPMVADHLGDDESQDLLREHRIETGLFGQSTQPRHLSFLTDPIRWWQSPTGFELANLLGAPEPLGKQMHQRRVEIVDAGT